MKRKSGLRSSADQESQPLPPLPALGMDRLARYEKLRGDLFCRRQAVWDIAEACSSAAWVASSMAYTLSRQEVRVLPTNPNPSRADWREASRQQAMLYAAMGRRDGLDDFTYHFVKGLSWSVTGAVPELVFDERGDVVEIGMVDPLSIRPYHEVEGKIYYDIHNDAHEVNEFTAAGIWSAAGGLITYYPESTYAQIVRGAYGRGAFLSGRPAAEDVMLEMATFTDLETYLSRVLSGTDAGTIVMVQGVNGQQLQKQMAAQKSARMRGRQNPEEQGSLILLYSMSPDAKVDLKSANLRSVPEGLDLLKFRSALEDSIAAAFGVKPDRSGGDRDSNRMFGNARKQSLMDANEPGLQYVAQRFTNFITNVVFWNKRLRAEYVGFDNPSNHARIAYDMQVSQVVSQLGDTLTRDEKRQYLIRRGVMSESDLAPRQIADEGTKTYDETDELLWAFDNKHIPGGQSCLP